ncbi:MAG TPA: phosphate ABC transporter substrate-binding protein PstS family protein [Methylocella sp.]|nr:phosphate ABC transporter substrate-binding protein PstS family protein [Methylocella sp.]
MKPQLVAAMVFAAGLASVSSATALDASLPIYQAVEGISGQIKSVGSDTLENEMALWAKEFEALYPNVKIEIEGKGSATAPPALLSGASQFGPMSRPMTADEISAFEKKFGYKPARFRVAVDALAVYVNKDNPIPCLTLQQVDQIFSATRQGSGSRSIDTWGDVGMTGEWATQPIAIYGRNSLSGTYEFFKKTVLYGGDYKEGVKQQIGSAAVVEGVAHDKFAIGYSGLGYKTDGVRTVPLAAYYGRPCYETTAEATYSGKYPIARYLYIYLNKKPDEPLDPLRAEFIKYILSKDGQTQTEKGGFFPITNEIRDHDLEVLGISTVAK